MSKIIFDASAILAILHNERGADIAEKYLPHAVLSTVNLSEVVSVLVDIGMPISDAENLIRSLIKEIIPFDEQQAFKTGSLRKNTKKHGLSLGDRACLSLAKLKNLPVLTADKAWSKLNQDFEVILIR